MQIVQFCNYIVSKNNSEDASADDIVTLLTGDFLTGDTKKRQNQAGTSCSTSINFMGILESIPVKTEQISQFYGKYKKK